MAQRQAAQKRKAVDLSPEVLESSSLSQWIRFVSLLLITHLIVFEHAVQADLSCAQSAGRQFHVPRHRTEVRDIVSLLGPGYFRRAYRMTSEEFTGLCALLAPHMQNRRRTSRKKKKRRNAGCPNGYIPVMLRVSAALRYCAGGSPYDIMLSHGMSHSSVFVCLWDFIGAVNKCTELSIVYPSCHEKQEAIARGFQAKSMAGFDTCAGCIDGVLIWTEKPTEKECEVMQCGSTRFLCGRKGKFGFNMQAICDSRRRFLDIWILHPASSSDFLAYIRSSFYAKCKDPVSPLLKPGLAIFGDNAYVSSDCMVSPYKSAQSRCSMTLISTSHSYV